MALNFSILVYRPAFNVLARPVTFSGGASPSGARGIYRTDTLDVVTQDGGVLSDQRTELDVLDEEFNALPSQGDLVDIPATGDLPALGQYKVIDSRDNGGGVNTLTLRKMVEAKPP